MPTKIVRTLAALTIAVSAGFAQQPSRVVRQQLRYDRPLTFELNQGQTGPQVNFLSRSTGYTAFLTVDGIVLTLRPSQASAPGKSHPASTHAAPAVVRMKLVGSNPSVAIGEDPKPGKVNYFIGNDRSKWHTNVPTYGRVRYKNIYPGIDLIYYGNNRQLEYDFAVSAGANPNAIQFDIEGANNIAVDDRGNLVFKTKSGELRFQAPAIYQELSGTRVPIQGTYLMKGASRVGFQVKGYDAGKALVIDPALAYSTYIGGSGTDQPTGIAVDNNGCVYLSGYTDSADFPLATLGSLPSGSDHVFVAKFDAAGSNLVYADYIGGNGQDYGTAIALNSSNEVYVTGSTASSDFPTVNAYNPNYPGSFNGFVSRISANGSSLLYSTYLGGNGSDNPSTIAVDGASDFFVAGNTSSSNFPTMNAYQSTISSNQGGFYGNYGFLTKFSPDGSSLLYSTYFAGNSNVAYDCGGTPCWGSPFSTVQAITLDASGNAYVIGNTNTYNFPTTSGAYLTSNSTQFNASVGFVSKFDGSGSLDYSSYFYEASGLLTNLNAVAVDGAGSAYVAGTAYSDGTFPVTSTTICDPGAQGIACSYAFVTKFDATAATLVYSTFLGPNNYATPAAIAVDSNNNAYVVGSTSSNLFSVSSGVEQFAGGNDILLAELDPTGASELFSTYLGGSLDEYASGMALDADRNIYITGTTDSVDLPTTQGAAQLVLGGNTDGFVMKLANVSAPAVSLTPSALEYSSLQIGTTSTSQQVLLRNMGSTSLTIATSQMSGDFAETGNCGTSVPAAGSCQFSITFTPTTAGSRTGSLSITDDTAGSPHIVTLTGTGVGAVAHFSASSVTFPGMPVGSSSTAQTVTLTNQGDTTLNITNMQVSGDFSQTNNCGSTLGAAASCTFNLTFTPTASGSRTGALTITDSAAGSPQSLPLAGSGVDFSLTSSSSSATVNAGGTASYTLTLTPVGGTFSSNITVTCSGAPQFSTCNLVPVAVTPGSNPATVNLSVVTTSSSAALIPVSPNRQLPTYLAWMQVPGFGLLGMLITTRKCRKKNLGMVACALLVSALLFLPGCAGGTGISRGGSGTPPGTYNVTVTAAAGTLHHSMELTLTVQ